MINDDNDKARRNLVAISSFILIFYWLGINETILFEKFFGHKFTSSFWKLSVLLIVILAYFSLRYRFADSTKNEYSRLISEWNYILSVVLEKRIHKIFNKFVKTHNDFGIFLPKLDDYVISQKLDTAFGERKDWDLISLLPTSIIPKDKWNGEIGVSISLISSDGSRSIRTGGIKIDYSFNGFQRYRLIFLSLIWLITYTKGAIDFIVPILLTSCSFIILIWRLLTEIQFS